MSIKKLTPQPTIHDTAVTEETILGQWTEIGAYTSIVESSIAIPLNFAKLFTLGLESFAQLLLMSGLIRATIQ